MLKYRSEFPAKIRAAIQLHKSDKPKVFYEKMRGVLGQMLEWGPTHEFDTRNVPWGGFDAAIDTEEEFEVSIRMFPYELYEERQAYFTNEIDAAFDDPETIVSPSWVPKIFPFTPIFARVLRDVCPVEFDVFVRWLVIGLVVADEASISTDDGDETFRRRIDKITLTILAHLRESSLLTNRDLKHVAGNIFEQSSWNSKRLRFLIDCYPAILEEEGGGFSLFRIFLNKNSSKNFKTLKDNKSRTMRTIEMYFEAGMVHYPNEMGFLFHTGFVSEQINISIIEALCDICGREAMAEMVQTVLSRCVRFGKPDVVPCHLHQKEN